MVPFNSLSPLIVLWMQGIFNRVFQNLKRFSEIAASCYWRYAHHHMKHLDYYPYFCCLDQSVPLSVTFRSTHHLTLITLISFSTTFSFFTGPDNNHLFDVVFFVSLLSFWGRPQNSLIKSCNNGEIISSNYFIKDWQHPSPQKLII